MWTTIRKMLLTNGLEPEVFADIEDRIHNENLYNQGTFVPFIMIFIMLVLGFQFTGARSPRVIMNYEIVGMVMLILQQAAYYRKLKSKWLTIVLTYVSMEYVLVGTLLLYLLVPSFENIPSMVFLCALLAMPLSVVDRVWRMWAFIVANELLFLYVSYSLQEPDLYSINRSHSYLFLIVSLFLYTNIVMRTVQHMSDQMFIEIERDMDELTRLLNRKAASTLINRMLGSSNAGVLLMIDVDHFKEFNDEHGHLYGDQVLQKVANVLSENFRRNDIIARFGGDEFIVYMPEYTLELAEERVKLIQKKLREVSDPGRIVTLSVGIAAATIWDRKLQPVLGKADQAVYQVKKTGRNGYAIHNE